MNRWAKRYRDALRSVEALRSEVNSSELAPLLSFHMTARASEIDAAKSHLKKSHMMKINIIYIDENRQWEKIMQLSAEIIQQNYLLLRSMGRLDNVMLEKMERLVKLDHCQRGVKFTDDDDQGELMKEVNITDTSIEEITNLSDCYDGGADDMEMDCGVKRLKDDDDESEPEHDFKKHKYEANMAEFKKPKALRPLNFKPQSLSVKTTYFQLSVSSHSSSQHKAASVISRYRMMKAGAVSSSSSTTAKLTATTPKKGLKSTYDSDGERKAPPRLTKK
ncbi:hypothetical protein quinque_004112 [Culex quinquefasciatus]